MLRSLVYSEVRLLNGVILAEIALVKTVLGIESRLVKHRVKHLTTPSSDNLPVLGVTLNGLLLGGSASAV